MKLFGILNLSPDSFSDGGKYTEFATAAARIKEWEMFKIYGVDLGAVSTNPDAQSLTVAEEIARLKPIINHLQGLRLNISLDSFATEVQAHFLSQVHYLNDVTGFSEPGFYPELAKAHCKLVVMHSVQGSGRADKRMVTKENILPLVEEFFNHRLEALRAAGVDKSRIILDPGMGFFLSKDPESSIRILQSIKFLKERFSLPVYISTSRKSFLRELAGCPLDKASAPTLVTELFAIREGAEYIRSHEPENIIFAERLLSRLKPDRTIF